MSIQATHGVVFQETMSSLGPLAGFWNGWVACTPFDHEAEAKALPKDFDPCATRTSKYV